MNCAGLIYDHSKHYLDHLAPLCSLLDLPLILCEPALVDLAHKYYPDLTILEERSLTLKLPSHLITCDNRPILKAAFPNQNFHILWLPHGHSDKGWNTPLFDILKGEKITFAYGQKMADSIGTKHRFLVGNFRWHYFQKHKKFYEKLYPPSQKKTYLYAPTWDDAEKNNSFWASFSHLVKILPEQTQLLVKLHPNTVEKFLVDIELLKTRYEHHSNLIFLPDLPPIYPLLNLCDAYIGDMSSIGYDFLTFDKPLYFFNAKSHLPLHQCGAPVSPNTFSDTDSFSPLRKKTYDQTFAPDPHWAQLRETIDALCCL